MNRPTLSVGMPNFNHARFLPAALDALLAQSYQPLEIIVLDDGSTDDSLAILRDYARRHAHLRLVVHERNQGAVATLGELLHLAVGDYFFAPAADDLVLPGLWEKSMALLERHPDAGLCSAQSYTMDEEGNRNGLWAERPGGRRDGGCYLAPAECAAIFWRNMPWFLGNTVVFRRQALLDAGGYQPELGAFCDGFMHQVLALAHGACFIPEPLAVWRRLPTSYASRTGTEPERMRRIRDTARAQMLGRHRRLFATDYVRRWERRWNFSSVRNHTVHRALEWRRGARVLLLPGGVSRRMLCVVMGAIVFGVAAAIQLAALLCLIPFDLGRIARRDLWQLVFHRRHRLSA